MPYYLFFFFAFFISSHLLGQTGIYNISCINKVKSTALKCQPMVFKRPLSILPYENSSDMTNSLEFAANACSEFSKGAILTKFCTDHPGAKYKTVAKIKVIYSHRHGISEVYDVVRTSGRCENSVQDPRISERQMCPDGRLDRDYSTTGNEYGFRQIHIYPGEVKRFCAPVDRIVPPGIQPRRLTFLVYDNSDQDFALADFNVEAINGSYRSRYSSVGGYAVYAPPARQSGAGITDPGLYIVTVASYRQAPGFSFRVGWSWER